MFGSTVLEVMVGMTFCYASVALIVSSLNEAIASALRLRSRALLSGIMTMLNDPQFSGLALSLYQHALVSPHDDGGSATQSSLKYKPSYIDPHHFAVALIDTLQTMPGNFERLGQDIAALHDRQLRQLLGGIYRRANGDLQRFEHGLAAWFDSGMNRVSGAYKRRSQLISVLLAMLLAIAFNIDSVHLFSTLWQHPTLTAQLGNTPPVLSAALLDAFWRLPIGWQHGAGVLDDTWLLQIGGWIVTASSALFGAPFWFDLLQRMVQLRGTGTKPPETKPNGK